MIQPECCGVWKAVCKQRTQSILSQHLRKWKYRTSLTAPRSKWQRRKESGQFSDTKHDTVPPAHRRASQLLLSFLEHIRTQILRGGKPCLVSHVSLIQYVHAWFEDQTYHTRGNQCQGMINQSEIICQVIENEYLYSMLQVKNICFWSSGQDKTQNSVWDVNSKRILKLWKSRK